MPQMNLVREPRKATEETISKQLEYVIKGHIALHVLNGFIL